MNVLVHGSAMFIEWQSTSIREIRPFPKARSNLKGRAQLGPVLNPVTLKN